jgi:hypothetical protein
MISRFSGGGEARGLGWLVERTKKSYAQRWLCREQSASLTHLSSRREQLRIHIAGTLRRNLTDGTKERLEVALRWHWRVTWSGIQDFKTILGEIPQKKATKAPGSWMDMVEDRVRALTTEKTNWGGEVKGEEESLARGAGWSRSFDDLPRLATSKPTSRDVEKLTSPVILVLKNLTVRRRGVKHA